MPINPKCDKCKNELDEFGGILLSPPDIDRKVKKYHLCKDCFIRIEKDLLIDQEIINLSKKIETKKRK